MSMVDTSALRNVHAPFDTRAQIKVLEITIISQRCQATCLTVGSVTLTRPLPTVYVIVI